MQPDLTAGLVRILRPDGSTAGTGFVVSADGLITTCSHVIQSEQSQRGGEPRLERVVVVFHTTGERREAVIESGWWRAYDTDDVAILKLEGDPPYGVFPLALSESAGFEGHSFRVFGHPQLGKVEGGWATGEIKGLVRQSDGRWLLQRASPEIYRGLSRGPVLDLARGPVVGMVTEVYYLTQTTKHRDTGFATPVEVLKRTYPDLLTNTLR